MPLSATLFINELSNKLKQQGKKVYKFGLGQSPFPVPKIIVEELRVNAFQKDYQQVKGLLALEMRWLITTQEEMIFNAVQMMF
jgi:aspartate/methionine/tyrosine aminotransferase